MVVGITVAVFLNHFIIVFLWNQNSWKRTCSLITPILADVPLCVRTCRVDGNAFSNNGWCSRFQMLFNLD